MELVVDDVAKRYGNRPAVDGLSFTRSGGGVTGLLGANGSGKSTTLRMMLGLTAPERGRITWGGLPYREHAHPAAHIGSMLDAQANHRGRTGREILRLSAGLLGLPRRAADDALVRVGLAGAEGKRFGAYSLGMKQRLGIAQALLASPRVLVLDEPANGLDPEGIWWMRDLLGQFAADGGLVILSSHLLHEVQTIADSVVMIAHGRLIADTPLADIAPVARTTVAAEDPQALADALRGSGLEAAPTSDGAWSVAADAPTLGRLALAQGLVLTRLSPAPTESLESMFFRLADAPAEEVARAR